MIALRRHIEKAVRPVRASNRRKDRMREELLAHLSQIYAEELDRCGEEKTALASALVRFGDPVSLSRELQGSVPIGERWFLTPLISKRGRPRPGESQRDYYWRMTRRMSLIMSAYYGLMILAVTVAHLAGAARPPQGLLANVGFIVGIAILTCVCVVASTYLNLRGQQVLASRDGAEPGVLTGSAVWRGLAPYAVGGMLLMAGAAAVGIRLFEYCFAVPLFAGRDFWLVIASAALVGGLLTALQSRDWNVQTRRFERWESLDLCEQSPGDAATA